MIWGEVYIFLHWKYLDLYEIPFFKDNISCVKLLVDPVQEDFQELLFDDPERDGFGEPTYIPGEKCFCF